MQPNNQTKTIDPNVTHILNDEIIRFDSLPTQLPAADTGAYLILFLSDFKAITNEAYKTPDGGAVEGILTNDAPIKYLLKCIKENNEQLTSVLCITSNKVRNDLLSGFEADDRSIEKETAFTLFEKRISVWYGKKIKVTPISYDYSKSPDGILPIGTTDVNKIAINIFQQISTCLKPGNRSVYIDYTGGFRDISFLMTALIRFIEFSGIKTERIVYSSFNSSPKSVIDIGYIYRLYQLINGTSAFLSTGNASELSAISSEKNADDVIKSMMHFSQVITVCNISEIDKAVNSLDEALKNYQKHQAEEFQSSLIQYLIPAIKRKLYLDKNLTANGHINYPLLIKWCLDNGLLQQAITLFAEKMPVYYSENNLFAPEYLGDIKPVAGSTPEYAAFYINVYDLILDCLYPWRLKAKEISRCFLRAKNELGSNNTTQEQYFQKLKSYPVPAWIKTDYSQVVHRLETLYSSPVLPVIYGRKKPIDSKLHNFLSSCINNPVDHNFHFLLVNDEENYLQYERLTRNPEGSTDSKGINGKTTAVCGLYKGEISEEILSAPQQESLLVLTAYYLAIKLLRNRMNHASEKEISDVERDAIRRLFDITFKDGSKIHISMEYQDIKDLLNKALSACASVKEPFVFHLTPGDHGKVKKLTDMPAASEKWKSVQIPMIEDCPAINAELLKEYAQIVIYMKRIKSYPEGRVKWKQVQADAASSGNTLPEGYSLYTDHSGKLKSPLKLLTEKYPEHFIREDDPQAPTEPFIIITE